MGFVAPNGHSWGCRIKQWAYHSASRRGLVTSEVPKHLFVGGALRYWWARSPAVAERTTDIRSPHSSIAFERLTRLGTDPNLGTDIWSTRAGLSRADAIGGGS